jgi:hypothetical protein
MFVSIHRKRRPITKQIKYFKWDDSFIRILIENFCLMKRGKYIVSFKKHRSMITVKSINFKDIILDTEVS